MTTQKYQYMINPRIAQVTSSIDFIPYFSLGENLDLYSEQSSRSVINVSFAVAKDFSYEREDSQKFHFFYGYHDHDEVYYERPLSIGIKLKMHVKDLFGSPKITVNRDYYRYVRFKADNVYPPGIHLVDTISINLLKKMYAPLHCAAISSERNEGIILVAPPDTGKTLTTFSALKRGFHFLAEDIAFVDEKHVYANPYTATFLHGDLTGSKRGSKSFASLVKKIPAKFDLFQYYIRPPKRSISDIVKNVRIDEKSVIKKVYIMDRGKRSCQKIDSHEALRRILIINRNEFSYHKNPLFFAYSYFNPSLDINALLRTEEGIINTIVNNADCFLINANDPREYIELISDEVKKPSTF
jgi:hypothetical protein